jgi:hypothetical protein
MPYDITDGCEHLTNPDRSVLFDIYIVRRFGLHPGLFKVSPFTVLPLSCLGRFSPCLPLPSPSLTRTCLSHCGFGLTRPHAPYFCSRPRDRSSLCVCSAAFWQLRYHREHPRQRHDGVPPFYSHIFVAH